MSINDENGGNFWKIDLSSEIGKGWMAEERAKYQTKGQEEKKEFLCPVCGAAEYRLVRESNGILGPCGVKKIIFYVCAECSVVFMSLEKATIAARRKNGEEV